MTPRRRTGSREDPPPPQHASYWSPGSRTSPLAGQNTQKHPHSQVDAFTFRLKNLYQDIISIHFVRNRSRLKNSFTSGHFELYLFKVFGVIYATSHPDYG
jgi:hypothetical protein